jgi:hypothetical protein
MFAATIELKILLRNSRTKQNNGSSHKANARTDHIPLIGRVFSTAHSQSSEEKINRPDEALLAIVRRLNSYRYFLTTFMD